MQRAEFTDIAQVTDWFDNTPPCIGWWNTRRKDRPNSKDRRRWWNGYAWSLPVHVCFDSDDYANEVSVCLAHPDVQPTIQWQGLTTPAPVYPYLVQPFLPLL